MKILCVTKCPTGMVQTYVAAEKLEQAGKKLGIDLSVETQGAMGIKNQFSPEQIDEADYIVIAADVAIDEASASVIKALCHIFRRCHCSS